MSDTELTTVAPEVKQLRTTLGHMHEQFRTVLPTQISPDKFIRIVITAVQMNQELLAADRTSLFSACMKAAQDGLLVDGREAALVIFNKNVGNKTSPKWEKQVQYMPMIAGILKKVRNSGEVATISAHIVYDKDDFEYWIDDDGEHLNHHPKVKEDRGKPTHAYAIAKTKDGFKFLELMSASEVDDVRQSSRSKDGPSWTNWWSEMAKKTVLRRLSKRLPMSSDVEEMINEGEEYITASVATELPEHQPKASRLSKLIQAQAVPPATEQKAAIPAPDAGEREAIKAESAAAAEGVPL